MLERRPVVRVAHQSLRNLRRDSGASQASTERRTQAVEVRDSTAFVDEPYARAFEVELAREVRDLGREHAIGCLRARRADPLQLGEELGVQRHDVFALGLAVADDEHALVEIDARPCQPNEFASTQACEHGREVPPAATALLCDFEQIGQLLVGEWTADPSPVAMLVELRQQLERMRCEPSRLSAPVAEGTVRLTPGVHRARRCAFCSATGERAFDGFQREICES